MDLINNQKVIGTELTGTNIKSHTVDPLTSSMTIGQLWQKSIDSPFVGLDEDNSYTFTNAQISVDGTILDPAPENMANSIAFPKIQFGFWWEESVNSKIITTFFTGVSTFLPEWSFTNNQSGDYKAGMPINISYPEVPEYFYYDRSSIGQSIQVFENTINQDYICHVNPAFNITSSQGPKETGDIPGYKIDPRWDLCGNNFVNYNHGSWYETLTPDGQGNFTNGTLDASGQKRFTLGKKFRVKVGQFDLWGQSSNEDWSLDECYILVRVKHSSDYTHLDPTNDPDHKQMPFMISNVFYQSSAYGVFNESFLGDNASMNAGGVRPYDSIAADVTCWESINKYVTQTPPFFFTSMSAPFSDLISVHYTTNFDIFAYNFSEDNSKRPHYSDRYLRLDNLSTPFEYQSSAWVNQGYFKNENKYTYSVLANPINSSVSIPKRDNDGSLVPFENLEGLPEVMETESYNGFAYYVKEVSGEIVPDFNEPKFSQGKGYFGDLGVDPPYAAGTKTKFETRLVDYIKQPFYWNKIFSSSTNSIRTLMGKMSTALIFTQEEYQDLYSVASPTRDGLPVCWPAFNEYGFNTFDNTVLSSDSPETRIGNTLIGEFLMRSKIASGFDWKVASDKNVYTWINKTSNNSGTAKYVPAYDLLDFHRANIGEITSSITPQVSLKTISPTTSAPTSVNAEAQTEPSPRYTLQEKLSEPVKVWHKGVKIPIYIRILDYPYTKTLNNRSYQGLGTTAETGNAFSVFLSGMVGYTASYNQSTGLCENTGAIDYYTSWHTPGPNTIQQHAGQKNVSLGDLGKSSQRGSAPFGVHQGTSDGAVFYDSAGNAETSLIEPVNNQTYNSKYKTILDKNQGALWRYPEAISSAYSFSNKNNNFHRIGYVQFPKTPHIGEGYVKEIAMLAVKNNTDDSTNITNAISSNYSTNHLMADTGDVMIMSGGMCAAINKLAEYMDVETAETQAHNAQSQYSIKPNGTFSWYNDSVPGGFTQNAAPEDNSYSPYSGSGAFENDGMYKYTIPTSNYNAFTSTLTQQEYFALPGYPVATDVNEDGEWLATEPNRKMYNFSADSSRYNPNTFAAQNHIGDDDIAVVHDNATAVAHGISTKLGEYMTNCSLESFKIKVIDQPYFFAQSPRYAGDVFFGNYKHITHLPSGTTSNTVGRFYFYEGHDQFHLYEPMSVGIPALLERTQNIPGTSTIKSKNGTTVLDTYTPPRADYSGDTATGKSFIRTFNLVKASNKGQNEHIGMSAVDGATRSLVIDDTVADGAGVKVLTGICQVKDPPTMNSIPNRQNFGKDAYMIFYNSDTHDYAINFNFPFNAADTGHAGGRIDFGGATGLTQDPSTASHTINIQTSDLTGGVIDIVLDDYLRLALPDEISSISYGGNSFLLTDSILSNELAIQAVYQNVLGRSADQGGLDSYKLENYSVNVLIDHFMASNEYKSNLYHAHRTTQSAWPQALNDVDALPDPRGDYREDTSVNKRKHVTMTPIVINRSTLSLDTFINHKHGHLWIYKDRSLMYDGGTLNNPAAINTQFGNIWAEDSHLNVSWNNVPTHVYDFVDRYKHNTSGSLINVFQHSNLTVAGRSSYTLQRSHNPSGDIGISVNQDWFLGSSFWTNEVKFELVDGTNLPTTFSKSLPASYSVRGVNVPEATNFSAEGVIPDSYKLYLGSITNFIGEPTIDLNWSAKVYSNIEYSGSSDSYFYDKGMYKLTFGMADGTEVVKNLEKGRWKTPEDAGPRNYFQHFFSSYPLSDISPILKVPISAKLTVSDEIFPYGSYDEENAPLFFEVSDNDIGIDLDANIILNKFPTKIVDIWQFKDVGGNWRDFNTASHNTSNDEYYTPPSSLLLGTGSTFLSPGNDGNTGGDSFEGASEALVYRQRSFFAPLCQVAILNTSTGKAKRLSTDSQGASFLNNMVDRGVDFENLHVHSPTFRIGSENAYYSNVSGGEEYNYWSLDGTFSAGKHSSMRAAHSIDLTCPTAHDVFTSNWNNYGHNNSNLPPVIYRGLTSTGSNAYFLRNLSAKGSTSTIFGGQQYFQPFDGFDETSIVEYPSPSNNNAGRGDNSIMFFSDISKSDADYKKPVFVTVTKMRGWQITNIHKHIMNTDWNPDGKTVQQNVDAYKNYYLGTNTYGPSATCIAQGSDTTSDQTRQFSPDGSSSYLWAPWGEGARHLNSSDDLWKNNSTGYSFIGRKSAGYFGFQGSGSQGGSASRMTKRVNGVFPGVTYRLYFTAAYRPGYWDTGCRVYVLEPHVGTSEPEDGDAEHKLSRELIAYGEYKKDSNRWINYNVKRNVMSALGRDWQESDGYGFTCNMLRQNPYELDACLSPGGQSGTDKHGGTRNWANEGGMASDKFKVFYIEFTPKKGSHVVEFIFEQAYTRYHDTVDWQSSYGNLEDFRVNLVNNSATASSQVRKVPDDWVEIPENDFFDPLKYNQDKVRNWTHAYRGPWESNPSPLTEAGTTIGPHAHQRVGTWFLDEVWMTATRPCWVESVKFKYNVHQGGYLLSIDQGDQANRPVDDVFLCNPDEEVIQLGGLFPDNEQFTPKDNTNGYFKPEETYEIDIIRQHTHIQNWDPYAIDNDSFASVWQRTNVPLVLSWIPGDYHAGLVFSAQGGGLYKLKNSGNINQEARFGINNVIKGEHEYRAKMPTTTTGYNAYWEWIGSDPLWNTGAGAISMPGWSSIMNDVNSNGMSLGQSLIRNPHLKTITPDVELNDSSFSGNDAEIDSTPGLPHFYTSYEHQLSSAGSTPGVHVKLPVLGETFFFDKNEIVNHTGKEAYVDFDTGIMYEGKIYSKHIGGASSTSNSPQQLVWQKAAISNSLFEGSYSTFEAGLSTDTSNRKEIFGNGRIFLIFDHDGLPTFSSRLGKELSEEIGSNYASIFTSTALWPWFMDAESKNWGIFQINKNHRHRDDKRTLFFNEGLPATHWRKWQIGCGQNMSPITRGSAYDKYLKLGHDFLQHYDGDRTGGYRNNRNWVGDYLVFNHGSLTNLFQSRPIWPSNDALYPKATYRPSPADTTQKDSNSIFWHQVGTENVGGLALPDFFLESSHNNNAFRFL